jgi:hypothetical protein
VTPNLPQKPRGLIRRRGLLLLKKTPERRARSLNTWRMIPKTGSHPVSSPGQAFAGSCASPGENFQSRFDLCLIAKNESRRAESPPATDERSVAFAREQQNWAAPVLRKAIKLAQIASTYLRRKLKTPPFPSRKGGRKGRGIGKPVCIPGSTSGTGFRRIERRLFLPARAGLFLLLAAALRIQRQAQGQSLLPDSAFRALEQAGDLPRRNDTLGSGLERLHFRGEPSTPLFLSSQCCLLMYLKGLLLAQGFVERTTI